MFPFAPKSILTIAASFALLGIAQAHAGVANAIPQLGDLERWTVFSLGGGAHRSQAFGHSSIEGDLAVAGNGNFLIGGRATLDGDIYNRSNGTVLAIDHAVIRGSTESRPTQRHAR